jgi:broad specificity phosphatase PhoE
MKKKIIVLLLVLMNLNVFSQEETITKYFFVRHAEKDRSDKTNKNPELTAIGINRANYWRDVLGNVKFDMIYSTNYKRTIQTAQPTAEKNNLEITFYDPRDMYDEEFQKKTKGKNVLVVGHSNTTAAFANKVIGEEKYPEIEDSNNSNLYVVTLKDDKVKDVLFKIEPSNKID